MKIILDPIAEDIAGREATHMVSEDVVAHVAAGCHMVTRALWGKGEFGLVNRFEVKFTHNRGSDETWADVEIHFNPDHRRPGPSTETAFAIHEDHLEALRGATFDTIMGRLIHVFRTHQSQIINNGDNVGRLVEGIKEAKESVDTRLTPAPASAQPASSAASETASLRQGLLTCKNCGVKMTEDAVREHKCIDCGARGGDCDNFAVGTALDANKGKKPATVCNECNGPIDPAHGTCIRCNPLVVPGARPSE